MLASLRVDTDKASSMDKLGRGNHPPLGHSVIHSNIHWIQHLFCAPVHFLLWLWLCSLTLNIPRTQVTFAPSCLMWDRYPLLYSLEVEPCNPEALALLHDLRPLVLPLLQLSPSCFATLQFRLRLVGLSWPPSLTLTGHFKLWPCISYSLRISLTNTVSGHSFAPPSVLCWTDILHWTRTWDLAHLINGPLAWDLCLLHLYGLVWLLFDFHYGWTY
jgi:hypothetical protein